MSLVDKIKKMICPKCKARRMLPGPFYDRFRVRCLECGSRFNVKAPPRLSEG